MLTERKEAQNGSRDAPAISGVELAAIRSEFPIVEGSVYWDNAAVSPISTPVRDEMIRQVDLHSRNVGGLAQISAEIYESGRHLAAELVNSRTDRISYIQNTSHGMSIVALGLDWVAGDNLVVPEAEFPSNLLVWMTLECKGVEIRKLKARAGALFAEDLRALVDERTRVVAVSQVQFYSGFKVDLASFGRVCSECGALLVVDGTQSVGALSLDMERDGVDVAVVSAHKWLLGPLGIGFMAFSDRAFERITPRIIGWLSVNEPFAFRRELDFLTDARRFEPGTENGAGMFGLARRLQQIHAMGVHRIESYILDLGNGLRRRATEIGFAVVSDWLPQNQSGIILLRHPTIDLRLFFDELSKARVKCSVRNEALRFSPHYFNNKDELDTIVDVLHQVSTRHL